MLKTLRPLIFVALLISGISGVSVAQPYTFPFTSGAIPMCDTSYFTANVTGVGQLYPPGNAWWYFTLQQLEINITSNHPQTLKITLTSPQGTTLLLSAFNGAGGANYTSCTFFYNWYPSITTGSAPFTGNWTAEGGPFSIFDYENGDGTWTITVIDTACSAGGPGPGGPWTAGWFDGNSGGSGGFVIDFSSPPPPPCWGFIPDNQATVCAGEPVDILGFYNSLFSGYTFTIYDQMWGGTPVPDPSAVIGPGTFMVEGYDMWSNCWYNAYFTIYTIPQLALGSDQIVNTCNGLPVNLGSLFNLAGLIPEWSFNGLPISGAAVSAATTPGVYQLVGQSSGNCNDTALVTLNISPGINLGIDQSVNACTGSVTDLTSLYNTAGLTANWYYGGSPFANPANASGNGVYTLVASDAGGCIDTAEVTITTTASSFLGGNQFVTLCMGGTIDLTANYNTAGMMVIWYYGSNPVPIGLPTAATMSGSYMLVATNASGCVDSSSITVAYSASAALGTDQTVTGCITGTYDLTPLYNTTGFTTAWYFNGSPVANPAAVSVNGNYMLVATTSGGCIDTVLVTLNVLQNPVLGANQIVSTCSGVPFDLTSLYSTGSNTPAWYYSGSPFSTPAAAVTNGMYTLIVTSASGCTDTAIVNLAVQPAPVLGADQTINDCITGTYDLTPLFNTSGLTASWYFNGSPVVNPVSVSANGNYLLVATSAGGCTDSAEVILNVSQYPNLGVDQNASTCSGVPSDLTTLFTTGGNTPSWYFSGTPFATPASAITAGVYTLIVTTTSGCTDTAEVTLAVQPSPALGPDLSQIICSNNSIDLTAQYVTTGLTAAWTISGNPVLNTTAVSTAGVYSLLVTSAAGCTDVATFTLDVLAAPALGTDQIVSICDGNSVDLTALFNTAGLTASWTNSGSPVADPTNVNAAGSYSIVATDASGCYDSAMANINVLTNPVIGPDQTLTVCDGVTIDLSTIFNTSGNTSIWTNSGNPVADPTQITTGGVYSITVTNPAGCTVGGNATLTFNPTPDLGADQLSVICSGTTTNITLLYNLSGLTASWTQGGIAIPDPTSVSVAGIIQLAVVNSYGCMDTALVTINTNTGPSLGTDQSLALCSWQTVDLSAVFPVTGLTATYTMNGNPVANYTAVYDSGMYVVMVTDANGCTDDAAATITNLSCFCEADFAYSGRCIQDPVQFELISDSALISAHWNFGGATADQYVADPQVKFNTNATVVVTLEATLSCGLVTVKKEMQMLDCADSCHFYLPSAFTPNGDGRNDTFTWVGECGPEEFSMEIYNRYGQLLYNSDNPRASWDGKFENADIPAGVYVYHVAFRLPYQEKQVLTGTTSVMR